MDNFYATSVYSVGRVRYEWLSNRKIEQVSESESVYG